MSQRVARLPFQIKVLRSIRWICLGWFVMINSIVFSPLMRSNDHFYGKGLPFLLICALIYLTPVLLQWLPGWLPIAIQVAAILWMGHLLTIPGELLLMLAWFPAILVQELVIINNLRRPPFVAVFCTIPPLLITWDHWHSFWLIIELFVIVTGVSYTAYLGVVRRLRQTEELKQTNLKLSRANRKIARLTAQKVHQEIARDLHDTLVQDIVGINMQLAMIKRFADHQQYPEMLKVVDKTQHMAKTTITESRKLINQYRQTSAATMQRSLKQGIRRIISDYETNYGLRVHLDLADDMLIKEQELHDIVQVVSEALMNIVKHAATREAWVAVSRDHDRLTLKIRNQGSSFNPQTILKNHFGIKNMRERAEKYQGSLAIHPLVDGVQVVAEFNVDKDGEC
ncbi:sensor histidine kinase [Limosilactobacillus caecicola]|uniref:sensor histidine kinase n=1 Tax=Limosilactobacillus caecicola TaxID=2941332 RepID=UPI00203D6C6A|nr:histidine kinase [Limosilactobacillus caecicola]